MLTKNDFSISISLYISKHSDPSKSTVLPLKPGLSPIEPRDINTAQRRGHTEIHYPKHKKKKIRFTIYVYPRESTDLTERVY